MDQRRTGRSRGLPALLALVAIVLALGAAIAIPLMRAAATGTEIALRQAQLAALRRAEREARLGGDAAPRRVLIAADTEGQGGAGLQQRFTSLAEAAKARIISVQVLPVKRQGQIAEIGIVASVTTQIDGLRQLLHALETELPLLVVDELAIRLLPSVTPPGAARQPVTIETTLRVRGFMATRGPA